MFDRLLKTPLQVFVHYIFTKGSQTASFSEYYLPFSEKQSQRYSICNYLGVG